ncbi:MAG: ATP-binding protein [Oscillospiraceae bacterium]|nr:ATP-binding protein [Oscillospiraceae bacterium]
MDEKRAQEYSNILSDKVDLLLSGFQCSNQILSIIMNQKMTIAEKNNIKLNTQIEDILFDFMDDIDITAIFANLWDNAIEACKKVQSDKRFINIIVGNMNDYIVICFENSFNGKISKKGDIILSTKKRHEGVGVSIITAAVKKYDGFINFENDMDTFKVKLMIPSFK